MIKNRAEACQILKVNFQADENEIKSAYKRLVKLYHPDSRIMVDTQMYQRVVEAYNYLCANPYIPVMQQTRIIGNTSGVYQSRSAGYSDFEKKYQKQKAESKRAFDERVRQFEEKRRLQREYDEAMAKINSIRLAEAIKQILKNT